MKTTLAVILVMVLFKGGPMWIVKADSCQPGWVWYAQAVKWAQRSKLDPQFYPHMSCYRSLPQAIVSSAR